MKCLKRVLMVLGLALCAPVMAQLPAPLAQPSLDLRAAAQGRTAVLLPDGSAIVSHDGRWLGGEVERPLLAKIRPDGTVDTAWQVEPNGTVFGLAAVGDELLMAGTFSAVNGSSRRGLAKVSITTGALSAWDPNAGSNSNYRFDSFAVLGNWVFVGGTFTQLGTVNRNLVAKVDLVSGAVDPGFSVTAVVSSPSDIIVRTDGASLFVAGLFSSVSGVTRSNAAKLSLVDGSVDPAWAPTFNSNIFRMEIDEGFVYLAGCFSQASGLARNGAARVSASGSGAVDATWNPAPQSSACLYGLNITPNHVYLGGSLSQLGAVTVHRVGRVAKTGTGAADPNWRPATDGLFTFGVWAKADGTALLLGDFIQVGATYTPGVARLDASGNALASSPYSEDRGWVEALASAPDGGTYVGGRFHRIGAAFRPGLLRLTPAGALDTAWLPPLVGRRWVSALVSDAHHVYVGGEFASAGTPTVNNLVRLTHGGNFDSNWIPGASGPVYALAIDEAANTVFAGGPFNAVAGQARNNVAELSRSTGLPTAFNPNPNNQVRAIAPIGDAVFIAGNFSSVAGVPRSRVAKVNRAGALDANFVANANSTVRALLPGPDGTLYVGGFFTSISGLGRTGLARLSQATGAPDPSWTTFPNSAVTTLAAASDGIYAGGNFSLMGDQPRQLLARISHGNQVAALFAPALDVGLNTVIEQGGRVLAGGFMAYYAPASQRQVGLLAFPLNAIPVATTTTITSDSPERSQPFQAYRVTVNVTGAGGVPASNQRVDISDDRGELCTTFLDSAGNGACELVGRVSGTRQLTARFAGTPLLLPSSATEPHTVAGESSTPPVNTAVDLRSASAPAASVRLSDGSLVIGGSFNRVGDQIRRGLAKLRPDGTLDTAFSADVIGSVTALARDSADNVYVIGSFGYINGAMRRNIAKLTPTGSVVSAWTAGTPSIEVASGRTTLAVEPDGNLLVQTAQTVISGSPSIRFTQIVRLSGSTGAVLPGFVVDLSTDSTSKQLFASLLVDGSDLYVFGSFDRVNGTTRAQIARVSRATGVLDPGFVLDPSGPVAGVSYPVQRAIADGAGGLYVAGSFTRLAGQAVTQPARVNSAGAVSAAFAPSVFSGVDAMLLLDGSLYVAGANCLPSTPCTFATARMDPQTGQVDPTFQAEFSASALHPLGPNLWLSNGAQLLDASGVLAMGAVQLRRADGVRVPAEFITRPPIIRALARQPDGATLIGGRFARVGGNQENLVRVTAAGQFDTTFAPSVGSRFVQAIGVSGTGEIFVGTTGALLKFTSTGARDTAFGTGGELASNGTIYAFAPQPDGLLVGGIFGTFGGVSRQALVKLDPATGAVDPVWNAQISANGGVLAMQRDASGDLFLGGTFTAVGGQPRQNLARITSTGALATSWNAPANNLVWSLLLDGNALYVGGNFSSLSGSTRQQIGRVDAVTGAVQPWNPGGTTFAGAVRAIARGQDGAIFLGGDFLRMGGAFRSRAAKLDPVSGLADPNWNPSFDGPVFAILAGYGDTPPRGARLAHIDQAVTLGGEFEFAGHVPMAGFTAVEPTGIPPREIFCSGFEQRACE
ncbi:MAG: delta-60 repeat domain-containing protein [Xanthomonadales bacterium]|nr:delta-60 repeat domain-containing protein [Xanthomonadales bacterium]